MNRAVFCIGIAAFAICTSTLESLAQDDFQAAVRAISAFRVPKEFTVQAFAAKPQLFNPVAICVDDQGRIYVAEDHRFLEGTPENRSHNFLLEDDLQINTLADRLEMQKKWAKSFARGNGWFTQSSDIVRRIVDTDGDGRADKSSVFADGFDGPLDGLGSGVIARDGKVWYTNIPNLWQLSDKNVDGKSDQKNALLNGFGVNAAFYGHDLHGLVWGPDGKLYFSVGDRGAHVVTKEGNTIANPRNGAVFRCHPDGSKLELIHNGLRNPQELAFDQYGNLFADDNNCDKGDDSRLVYVVPGGHSGWNMAYQTIAEPYLTGPWHAEGMWHLSHSLQPAYIIPPVGKLGAGPSGFVFSSGTSLPKRYANHFFYCNYTGNGGVESFAVEVSGASFKIVDHRDFIKPVKASDVEFGYDGKMYISDYQTSPWDRKTTGGRIYTIFDETRVKSEVVEQTRALFHDGFKVLSTARLVELFRHADMRVRLRAQFELVGRAEAIDVLTQIAQKDTNQLARLHAIWGIGQLAENNTGAVKQIVNLLSDDDPEVRAQTAKIIGEANYANAADALVALLKDVSPRVRFFAAISLGQLNYVAATPHLFDMLKSNDRKDRYLEHSGVFALEQIGNREAVQARAKDESAAVRMAVLLVQRRWNDNRIVQFLDDKELWIVTEAARAINDLPMIAGREELANLADRYRQTSGDDVVPLLRRIVNANFQLGQSKNIEAVIRLATSKLTPQVVRSNAINALAVWSVGVKRDRVNGFWRPVATRDIAPIRQTLEKHASTLIASTSGKLQVQVTQLLAKLSVKTDDAEFAKWVFDDGRSSDSRVAALRLLVSRNSPDLMALIEKSLRSNSADLRSEARDQLAQRDKVRSGELFAELFEDDRATVAEIQRAIATLSGLKTDTSERLIDAWAAKLSEGKVDAALQLDVIEALQASSTEKRLKAVQRFEAAADDKDSLSRFRTALDGGDTKRGREIFVSHKTAQCIRCHSVDSNQPKAGPSLLGLARAGRKHDRRYFLESIVDPNAKIAQGFGTVTFVLDSGRIVGGRIVAEDKESITVLTPLEKRVRIERDSIDDRTETKSTMPLMTKVLTLREIRDLVAYLSTLK